MNKGILIILDGYGDAKPSEYNAVTNANTPFLHSLKQSHHALLNTSGESVGIFKGELGGSEVGHLTIGAGRIIPSTVKKIHDDVLSGEFRKHKKLNAVLNALKKRGGNLHLIGMMSDKNVHSNINHAYEIIEMAKGSIKHIFLHLFTDGRDTSPRDSVKYAKKVLAKIKNIPNCEIASIGGRLYGMDRENNLDRTQKAYDAMFNYKQQIEAQELLNYLNQQHKIGNTDQYVQPTHIKTKADATLNKNDLLIMFNFREDRVRQLSELFTRVAPCPLVTMSDADTAKSTVLYPAPTANHTLSEYLSSKGLRQIKISETTKYAHVTYFMNGGKEEPFPNEDRVHIRSFKVKIFSETPKMRAKEIATECVKALKSNYDFITVNFSNPDMLGHTGDYEECLQSLEFMDVCVKKVVDQAQKSGYFVLITADHGNIETMRTASGEPHMAHTLNKVICAVLKDGKQLKLKRSGTLADISPTILELMGEKPYKYFEGNSLIAH